MPVQAHKQQRRFRVTLMHLFGWWALLIVGGKAASWILSIHALQIWVGFAILGAFFGYAAHRARS